MHDAGTGDAQYFSMMLNGSDSIVCFRDEESARRCGEALQLTGAACSLAQLTSEPRPPNEREACESHATAGMIRGPSTESVLLDDLLSSISEDRDVCLVDEVGAAKLCPMLRMILSSDEPALTRHSTFKP